MKRLLDIVTSGLGLLVLSPLLIVLYIVISWKMGRPVLFMQVRPGLGGKPFTMIKFRTMRDATDSSGKPLSDAERLTSLGKFMRAASLDELPELWNVLRGDMSLVGPRPLLMEYLPFYSKEQNRRHETKPGITGWAQVNGRNALSWDQKFELDVWYVDNKSLLLDLRILFMTAAIVFRRSGISSDGHATMPVFTGNRALPSAENRHSQGSSTPL